VETSVSTNRGRLPDRDGVEGPPRNRLHTLQTLPGADQERASLLPQRHGHRADASYRRACYRDRLLMLPLDSQLLIAELGDAAIDF